MPHRKENLDLYERDLYENFTEMKVNYQMILLIHRGKRMTNTLFKIKIRMGVPDQAMQKNQSILNHHHGKTTREMVKNL
jgi:calcineurin-like phosphoesterase family protein